MCTTSLHGSGPASCRGSDRSTQPLGTASASGPVRPADDPSESGVHGSQLVVGWPGSENSSHCPCPGARRPGRRDRRGSGCSARSGTRTGLAGRTDRLTSPAVGGSKSSSQQAFSIAERADRRSNSAISSWLPDLPPSAARAPATMAVSSVIAVCTAVNSVEGSVTLLSRLDLCAGGE
jgi:hypothetical protein